MIERNPHPIFAAIWASWGLFTIYLFVFGVTPALWIAWFLSFVVVEVVGVMYEGEGQERDTLSETMTWVQRYLSKHRLFLRGWNAAFFGFILVIGSVGTSLLTNRWQALAINVLIVVWLYDHWMNPDVHG